MDSTEVLIFKDPLFSSWANRKQAANPGGVRATLEARFFNAKS